MPDRRPTGEERAPELRAQLVEMMAQKVEEAGMDVPSGVMVGGKAGDGQDVEVTVTLP